MITDLFIKNLQLQNYKSIRSLDVRFNKGLNIIIGENGAGKTNLLEYLNKCLKDDLNPYAKMERYNLGDRSGYDLQIGYLENEIPLLQRIKKTPAKKRSAIPVMHGRQSRKLSTKSSTLITLISKEIEKIEQEEEERKNLGKKLGLHYKSLLIDFNDPGKLSYVTSLKSIFYDERYGITSDLAVDSNLAIQFEIFLRANLDELAVQSESDSALENCTLKVFNELIKEKQLNTFLKKFTPIEAVKLNDSISISRLDKGVGINNIQFSFKINGKWLLWSSLSDGTKRIFYIVLEAIDPDNQILLIEEPELGIHPHQLYKLMNFLKEMAEEKQIIITTHSPIALDVLSAEELDAIIIAKYSPKGTVMNHLTPAEIRKAKIYIKNEANLSGYWLHSDLEK